MKRSQGAAAIAATAGALALIAAKRRGISLRKWLRVQADIAHIIVRNSTKDGNWRWSRLRELLFLASLERSRRLEVAEADVVAPNDPDAVYRLHPFNARPDTETTSATSSKAMMALRMEADAKPVVTDLVLVGGGHAHVHVLRMLGMQPMPEFVSH